MKIVIGTIVALVIVIIAIAIFNKAEKSDGRA